MDGWTDGHTTIIALEFFFSFEHIWSPSFGFWIFEVAREALFPSFLASFALCTYIIISRGVRAYWHCSID